jgi:hypothetical protein
MIHKTPIFGFSSCNEVGKAASLAALPERQAQKDER